MKAAMALALVGAACSSAEAPPNETNYQGAGYAVWLPDEWVRTEDRGAVIATSPIEAQHTITVRSFAIPQLTPDLPARDPVADARAVVAALPGAEVGREWTVDAVRVFDVTYLPPGADAPYHRSHALFVGKTHLVHVIETAPVELDLAPDTLTAVVRSIREDG